MGARLEGLLRDHEAEMEGELSEGSDDDVLSHLGVEGSPQPVRMAREAEVRRPLSDSDEEVQGEGAGIRRERSPFDDPEDSDEEESLEMRPRRTS